MCQKSFNFIDALPCYKKCKVVSFLLAHLVLCPRCSITELICKEYLTTVDNVMLDNGIIHHPNKGGATRRLLKSDSPGGVTLWEAEPGLYDCLVLAVWLPPMCVSNVCCRYNWQCRHFFLTAMASDSRQRQLRHSTSGSHASRYFVTEQQPVQHHGWTQWRN